MADTFHILTLEVDEADARTCADALREAFGIEPVELQRPGSRTVWIEGYFDEASAADRACRVVAGWPWVRGRRTRVLYPRDWTSFWRRHFRAHAVGDRLWMVPVWERERRTPRGRLRILIDPGLSFGTGSHFTTRFCLESIVRCCRPHPPGSLLDVGTGSGILAMAAAKLGVAQVTAFDDDALAVAQAQANLRLNRVASRIRLFQADLAGFRATGRYDVVCANLFGTLIARHAARLTAAAGRTLILSGIREPEVDQVAGALEGRGMHERVRDGDGEWCGLVFERNRR